MNGSTACQPNGRIIIRKPLGGNLKDCWGPIFKCNDFLPTHSNSISFLYKRQKCIYPVIGVIKHFTVVIDNEVDVNSPMNKSQ
jgi:hypothetical protein